MKQFKNETTSLVVIFIVCQFLIGFLCGLKTADYYVRQEAIENNAARHNPETKEFEWLSKIIE
jgi:hypothetical protein